MVWVGQSNELCNLSMTGASDPWGQTDMKDTPKKHLAHLTTGFWKNLLRKADP